MKASTPPIPNSTAPNFNIENSTNMKSNINLEAIWSDIDLIEFRVTTTTELHRFTTVVYVPKTSLASLITDLEKLAEDLQGNLVIPFGHVGEDTSHGTFTAQLDVKAS